MKSDELRKELEEVTEREMYESIVKNYLRVKKLVMESGELCHDEVCDIAMRICTYNRLFELKDRSW